ncbi:sce7726 family protein [Tenacibaculum sp. A30]|uniref:sce7726 family protein n=1 Tax=Tenacibaculum sp. A30 TaxID=3442644 RepID=UPI003EB7295C
MGKNNDELNRMRSYSSIFSSTYFKRLLKNNDYSFINDKIVHYDKNVVGKRINTYNDYIRFVYGELRKNYRNEYVYKNTFINELVLNKYGLSDTNVINEFRVGNSVADIVMFNGTSKAFEIKTELDSNKRLRGQLSDYRKIFKESYIITHENLAEKYLKEDDSVGVIVLRQTQRALKMIEIRKAKINNKICPNTVMQVVRTNEYKNIVKEYFGVLPEMNSFNMFSICEEMIERIPQKDLDKLFISELKKRKTNTSRIKIYQKELKQLGLAMNLNDVKYSKLLEVLNEPIKL